MDSSKSSFEENPTKFSSSTSLDRAFVLSCNDSLFLNIVSDNETATDESLADATTNSSQFTNANFGLSDSTRYIAFPNSYTKFCKSDVQTLSSEANDPDNVDESSSRVNGGESRTDGSLDKTNKDTTLSKVLVHMIETILKSRTKTSKSTEKVIISDLSVDSQPDTFGCNNTCHSDPNKADYFSPSRQTAAPVYAINDDKDSPNSNSSSKLITILEGTNESASDLSNEYSPSWTRMYLGKLQNCTSPNNVTRDNIKRETNLKNDWNQNKPINGSTSSDIETSLSFETHDSYFDTIDSSINQYLEESGNEYTSASELSFTEDRLPEVTNDISENISDHGSKESITSKISKKIKQMSFGLVKNTTKPQRSISPNIKSESRENQKAVSNSMKSCLTPMKKKTKPTKRLNGSLSDMTSIHGTTYDKSGKDDTCTPIRHTKHYIQQKTPQYRQSTTKNTNTTNRIWTNNSPRLSAWRSPAVVTSPIKPVKFLRNLFHDIEMKNRGFGRPPTVKAKKIAKPMIFVTPASPLQEK